MQLQHSRAANRREPTVVGTTHNYWVGVGTDTKTVEQVFVHPWSCRGRQIRRHHQQEHATHHQTGSRATTRGDSGVERMESAASETSGKSSSGDASSVHQVVDPLVDESNSVLSRPLTSTPVATRTTIAGSVPRSAVPVSLSLPTAVSPSSSFVPFRIPSPDIVPSTLLGSSTPYPLQHQRPDPDRPSSSSALSKTSLAPNPLPVQERVKSNSNVLVEREGDESEQDCDGNVSEETNYSDAPRGRTNRRKRSSKSSKTGSVSAATTSDPNRAALQAIAGTPSPGRADPDPEVISSSAAGPSSRSERDLPVQSRPSSRSTLAVPTLIQTVAPNAAESASRPSTLETTAAPLSRTRRSTSASITPNSLSVDSKPSIKRPRSASARPSKPRSSSPTQDSETSIVESPLVLHGFGLSLVSSHPTGPRVTSIRTPRGSIGLFSRTAFLVTGSSTLTDKQRPRTIKQIEDAGGIVIDYPDLFEVEVDQLTREVKMRFETTIFDKIKILLVSDRPIATPKYLIARALGIPCCSYRYVTATISKTSPIPWSTHLLAGESVVSKDVDLASLTQARSAAFH